jgi:hypothetical protein
MESKAKGLPVKDFFIDMITRDIALQDCILDLLDNCMDGASKCRSDLPLEAVALYSGFSAHLLLSSEQFEISDNCGGISTTEAEEYAFNFGRNPEAPPSVRSSIGVYGIGMKRAVFKLGKLIEIRSSTDRESFTVNINVDDWRKKRDADGRDDWSFDMEKSDVPSNAGTSITITDLNDGARDEFSNPIFIGELRIAIARDYSFFVQKGFRVFLNGEEVAAYQFRLGESADFQPANTEYDDVEGALQVKIQAGMASVPPDDDVPGASQRPEVEYYGWFVACNDRVVLAGDKSHRTVWGNEGFPAWHPQYNGFMGIVFFYSSDLKKLPWTTTKRDLDTSVGAYRRAVVKMKEFTRAYIDYTNQKRENQDAAKQKELDAVPKLLSDLPKREAIQLPVLLKQPAVVTSSIQYSKPVSDIRKVAKALGNKNYSNTTVGIKTFDYYLENVVVED